MFLSSICCCENYFDVKHRIIILLESFSSLEYFNAGYKKKASPDGVMGVFLYLAPECGTCSLGGLGMPRQVILRLLVSSTPGRHCPLAVLTGSDPGSSRNPLLSIQLVTLLCLGSQFSSWQLYPFNSHLPLLKIFCGLKMFL